MERCKDYTRNVFDSNACILKAHSHSHSKSGGSIWASLECQCCFWITGWLVSTVSYLTMRLLALQLFKNSIDTQGKLRLNLLSVSVSELLEYRRMFVYSINITSHHCGLILCLINSISADMRLGILPYLSYLWGANQYWPSFLLYPIYLFYLIFIYPVVK
jgi:hypothetical protein